MQLLIFQTDSSDSEASDANKKVDFKVLVDTIEIEAQNRGPSEKKARKLEKEQEKLKEDKNKDDEKKEDKTNKNISSDDEDENIKL